MADGSVEIGQHCELSPTSGKQRHAATDDVGAAIAKHDNAVRAQSAGRPAAAVFQSVPILRGVGALLGGGLDWCEAHRHNDEEVAKAHARLAFLLAGLERAREILGLNGEVAERSRPVIQELERSLGHVVELLELRGKEHVSRFRAMGGATAFRDRFDSAMNDVERARNDLVLHLNIEAAGAALLGSANWAKAQHDGEISGRELGSMKEVIGRGGATTVFRSKWRGRAVAVKEVDLSLLPDDQRASACQMLRKEVNFAVHARHPQLIEVFGLCLDRSDCALLVMQLAVGGGVRTALDAMSSPPEASEALAWMADTCRGLEFLHLSQILHGNLRCSNLLFDEQRRVKVSDFGLGFQVVGSGKGISGTLTQGNCGWMAPECFHGCPTFASDVFAFGVCCWEMATLQNPWSGLSPGQVLLAVQGGQRLDLSNVLPALKEILTCCWAAEERIRPTASAIVRWLN